MGRGGSATETSWAASLVTLGLLSATAAAVAYYTQWGGSEDDDTPECTPRPVTTAGKDTWMKTDTRAAYSKAGDVLRPPNCNDYGFSTSYPTLPRQTSTIFPSRRTDWTSKDLYGMREWCDTAPESIHSHCPGLIGSDGTLLQPGSVKVPWTETDHGLTWHGSQKSRRGSSTWQNTSAYSSSKYAQNASSLEQMSASRTDFTNRPWMQSATFLGSQILPASRPSPSTVTEFSPHIPIPPGTIIKLNAPRKTSKGSIWSKLKSSHVIDTVKLAAKGVGEVTKVTADVLGAVAGIL